MCLEYEFFNKCLQFFEKKYAYINLLKQTLIENTLIRYIIYINMY
jgi:hypothetical protein